VASAIAEALKTTSVKEEVIQMIQRLPDDCTLEQIQYPLFVREEVERGPADIEAGRVVCHSEAKRRIAEWRKSFGQKQR
jgi:predicted transcriptional regulator